MLEGIVAAVINQFVGDYVENLNTDQLSIALLQGAVELENLPLKRDALKHFDLPLEVKSGFIGKITLYIPISRLKSEPWVISIEKLYLVAGPLTNTKYDEAKEKKEEKLKKKVQLDALEAKWKSQRQAPQESASSWLSFGSSLASTIVENIQLNVKNVHIRYEDDVTLSFCPFACGVIIKSLSAQSTDELWKPTYVSHSTSDNVYKLLDLQGFSVYWDTNVMMLGDLTMKELADALERGMAQNAKTEEFQDHEYLLSPVSAKANMKRNTSPLPLRSSATPRVTLDVNLTEIPVSLAEGQYKGLLAWMKEIDRHDKTRKYRRWRPDVSVKENPKAWWNFAINANLYYIHERNEHSTKDVLLGRCQDNVLYVKAYEKYLRNGKHIDYNSQAHIEEMEELWSLQEIKILREIAMETVGKELDKQRQEEKAAKKEATAHTQAQSEQSQGMFRKWLGWGWYGTSSQQQPSSTGEPPPAPTQEEEEKEKEAQTTKEDIEKELIDVLADTAENNTMLKRDTVFAQLNFCLQQGSFKLKGEKPAASPSSESKPDNTIIELKCTTITMQFVSRPRTKSLTFGVSIGGLTLTDMMTQGSVMKDLIRPQITERPPQQYFSAYNDQNVLGGGLFLGRTEHKDTLFELIYEVNPPTSTADYRFEIKTKPLDIAYNQLAIKRVKDFFTSPKSGMSSRQTNLHLAAAARVRIEELKNQTKAELKQTLDQLLEGEERKKTKRWAVNLDISAPQIIIPEDFCDDKTSMVVLDFGQLRFRNSSEIKGKKELTHEESFCDDDFHTPSSTPPNEEDSSDTGTWASTTASLRSPENEDLFAADLSESVLREKIYDRYILDLSDLQIMVGKVKDNWKHARKKGSSLLHVIDRFSISMQFERRLIYTADPKFPSATLSGRLPGLGVHVNEQKICSLRTCMDNLSGNEEMATPSASSTPVENLKSTMAHSTYNLFSETQLKQKQVTDDSKVFLMEFSVDKLSLEVQSRGRSIAELQVTGVTATATKTSNDLSVKLGVHGLLIADGLQEFGPDFELLVASHKHVSLDSQSGSLKDSEPTSPNSPRSPYSPQSPNSPRSPQSPSDQMLASKGKQPPYLFQSAFTSAVTAAFQKIIPASVKGTTDSDVPSSPPPLPQDRFRPIAPAHEEEALITVEVEILNTDSENSGESNGSGKSSMRIINIQFNSLDIIANQQTFVELLSFFKRVSPPSKPMRTKSTLQPSVEGGDLNQSMLDLSAGSETQISADFHRLNVLLMRVEEKNGAKKVATATLSSAKLSATIDHKLKLTGSLGGLQLMNLTEEGSKHQQFQKVFSVGQDPLADHDDRSFTCTQYFDMYKTAMQESVFYEYSEYKEQALEFTLTKGCDDVPFRSLKDSQIYGSHSDESVVQLNIKMASLCYTHSAQFLSELSKCATDFQDYISAAATSLKSAATEVAMGIVNKKTDVLGASMYGSLTNLAGSPLAKRKRTYSEDNMYRYDVEDEKMDQDESSPEPSMKFTFEAILETPVIVLPRTPDSTDVLVAHLGKINVRNTERKEEQLLQHTSLPFGSSNQIHFDFDQEPIDRMYIEIKNMNMFSVDLKKTEAVKKESDMGVSQADIYVQHDIGIPILHDTAIELTIETFESNIGYINRHSTANFTLDEDFMPSDIAENTGNTLEISGKIVFPLKLVLSKPVYEQILQTLDNLTYNETEVTEIADQFHSTQTDKTLQDIHEEDSTIEPSPSSLRLGEVSSLSSVSSISSRERFDSTLPKKNEQVTVKASFEIPIFEIVLNGDIGGDMDKGLVNVKLNDFMAKYTKDNQYLTNIQVSLRALSVEDLLQDENSSHRYLMLSSGPSPHSKDLSSGTKAYLSTSCPDSVVQLSRPHMPASLPSSFHEDNVFHVHAQQARVYTAGRGMSIKTQISQSDPDYPCTPPPTPAGQMKRSSDQSIEDALVNIKVLLVDRKSPDFKTKHKSTNHFIDVDFNCLDTTINLQTWVVLLDFLGMGAKVHDVESLHKQDTRLSVAKMDSEQNGDEVVNTEVDLKVQSLTLILNKEEYELAKANASKLKCHVSLRDGNFAVQGKLGSMSLTDETPNGELYRERFVTAGDEVLNFDILKYGLPDPGLERDFDIFVQLEMSSVRYIHTQRFISEILAFAQHFNQMQDVLGQWRAATSGKKISEVASRSSRISMDIKAGSPMILIPHSSKTTDVLVADLGTLTVRNQFLMDGSEGTISAMRSRGSSSASSDLNVPNVVKSDQNFESAGAKKIPLQAAQSLPLLDIKQRKSKRSSTRSNSESSVSSLENQVQKSTEQIVSSSDNTYKCLLDVMSIDLVDMDLYSAKRVDKSNYRGKNRKLDLQFSTCVIQRQAIKLLKEKCELKLQVERNLENDLSHDAPDFNITGALSSVHCSLDVTQYKLVRGLLNHNLGEQLEEFKLPMFSHLQDPKIQTVLSGDVWKGISISIELKNVCVELVLAHEQQGCEEQSLAQLHFLQSLLTFESFSDQSKDLGLVSHEIKAVDTRYTGIPDNQKPSVFTDVLCPVQQCGHDLQMELHYRATKDFTRATVLLNNMRLMCIFDWLLAVKEFLVNEPEDPFKKDQGVAECPKPKKQEKVGVFGGIATKRMPARKKEGVPIEFRMNVTDTEFVLVENMRTWDTSAVILKSTAVLSYRDQHHERPLSCSLKSLEVFSCCLVSEEETALSIIDPVTVDVELSNTSFQRPHFQKQQTATMGGLSDIANEDDRPPVLEVNFDTLNIRLSYNDMQLFLGIMNSLPEQASRSTSAKPVATKIEKFVPKHPDHVIRKLRDLGFTVEDCDKALTATHGKLDDAVLWLTKHATYVPEVQQEENGLNISGVELKANFISFCLIDDCQDADVPLGELAFSGIHILQTIQARSSGKASFRLVGDFYNRSLSGWEPVIEPWKCKVEWQQIDAASKLENPSLTVSVSAGDLLNINLTSVLLDQYKKTKLKWTDDYYKQDALKKRTDSQEPVMELKRRVPFVPYAIRNETGAVLAFATITSTPAMMTTSTWSYLHPTSEWTQVMPGDEMPFKFGAKDKIRHKKTHELKNHQIQVKVEGWHRASPVSLDKVGVYFRVVKPELNTSSTVHHGLPPARLVFDVKIEGSARKVITVRSALMVVNMLSEPVELKLDNSMQLLGDQITTIIAPNTKQPVPVQFISSKLYVRPTGWSLGFCDTPIKWNHINRKREIEDKIKICEVVNSKRETYRFCVSVRRDNYPVQPNVSKKQPSGSHENAYILPGHTITVLPAVIVVNLLPIEIEYFFKKNGINCACGVVKPGGEAPVHAADINDGLQFGIRFDGFPKCRDTNIPVGTVNYRTLLTMTDSKERLLLLRVCMQARVNGCLKISIYCPYWLINKSGIPLIFRQDSVKQQCAGQLDSNEQGQSKAPLLFSYIDKDAPYMCVTKVGSGYDNPDITKPKQWHPQWCHRFPLESGMGVRRLYSRSTENRPDKVYTIGIEVRQGKGRYRDTNIVTFSARFCLDNRTSKTLHYAQQFEIIGKKPTEKLHDVNTGQPGCRMLYHWTREDLDPLLSVRVDDENCSWSGGFRIDKVDSFHVNMRGENKEAIFLRVEVVLQGATYHVLFTDADSMPPPFRIDNLSEVPLVFYQTQVSDDRLRTMLREHTSMPYAWDQPNLKHTMTVCVQGGTKETYDMNVIGQGKHLQYENLIYIQAAGTFHKAQPPGSLVLTDDIMSRQLVLDVPNPENPAVVFSRKEVGKRSQLWRMTSQGLLQHEGSSVPRDPKQSPGKNNLYVLDIAAIAPQPISYVPLQLRKADPRRKSTQVWEFTEDGRLRSSFGALYIQSRDGESGLQHGAAVVVGPGILPLMASSTDGEIPLYMNITRQKMRPGSGVLSVKVLPDGPTRVLQIADMTQERVSPDEGSSVDDWVVLSRRKKSSEEEEVVRDLQVSVNLKGVGVSLVNKVPEELAYLSFMDIDLNLTSNVYGQILETSIKKIQVDNQLFGTWYPVMLFEIPKPPSTVKPSEAKPALQISAQKIPNKKWNAEIFKHLSIKIKRMTLQIEEQLLWKLLQFAGFDQPDSEIEQVDESDFTTQRALADAASVSAKRYYFGTLQINLRRVTLSVYTSSKLPPDLTAIKRMMGIPLIKFEDAKVEFDPFFQSHPFETSALLTDAIISYYTSELKSQAAKILGSVDFLGNPLGLVNDLTSGISGLVKEGNIHGLFKNVTHGLSNSAAKVTGSLSDNVSKVTMDDQHALVREQIKREHSGSTQDHMIAGIKGLGHGILGGLTSVLTQTVQGAQAGGVEGFLGGLGKGVIGTVTKPVTGMLDFASNTASAIRDTSRSSSKYRPSRVRMPRSCFGSGGLLPEYTEAAAEGQNFLFALNDNDYTERFIAMNYIRVVEDCLKALITDQRVYFLGKEDPTPDNVVISVDYQDMFECKVVSRDTGRSYIELTMKADSHSGIPTPSDNPKKRPQVRCDTPEIASKVCHQINYARNLHEETLQTLITEVAEDGME